MPELLSPLSPLPAVPDPAPPADARTCRLVTLGCKVNQYETQLVKEGLERHGYREAAEGEPA
ncbi:MAG: hypothetical protein ACKOFW_01635, partial [Planctomycetaceae bacterium]